MDYLSIGPTPIEEKCTPMGKNRLIEALEVRTFRDQCIRVLEKEFQTVAAIVSIKRVPYEDDAYSEVIVRYNEDSEESVQQAFWLESRTPSYWDKEALKTLRENNYPKEMLEGIERE